MLRLNGAQVTLLEEALNRYEDNKNTGWPKYNWLPRQLNMESLAEDFLRILIPEVSEWLINTARIQNAPQNANDSSRS